MSLLKSDYAAIYAAWQNFRKGKKPSPAVDEFAYDLEHNLMALVGELTHQTYLHGTYRAITVHEKKRRDLAVASVRDRVVHRLLYDYLAGMYDGSFDPDVWSCRKNKGLHKCLNRTQSLLRKYTHSYVWRADIMKFFDSVDQDTLLGILSSKLSGDESAQWLCRQVVGSYNEQNRTEQNRHTHWQPDEPGF